MIETPETMKRNTDKFGRHKIFKIPQNKPQHNIKSQRSNLKNALRTESVYFNG